MAWLFGMLGGKVAESRCDLATCVLRHILLEHAEKRRVVGDSLESYTEAMVMTALNARVRS